MRFPACEHLFLPLGTTLGSKRFMVAVGLLFLSLWLGELYLSTQILQCPYKARSLKLEARFLKLSKSVPVLFPLYSSSILFLSPSVKTANISCYLLLFYLLPFQPVISHFSLCYPRRTGLQWCLLKRGIFTDQGEALSTLVQSPPRVIETLWWTIHPGKEENYHIFSRDHPFWTEEDLLAQQTFALGWQPLICATIRLKAFFFLCAISH